jgi:hypothetical protein
MNDRTSDLKTACELAAMMGFQLLPVIPWMKNEEGVSVPYLHGQVMEILNTLNLYVNPSALSDTDREHYEIATNFVKKLCDELNALPIYEQVDVEPSYESIQQSKADDRARIETDAGTEDNPGEHAESKF